jgi:hypothetical protein
MSDSEENALGALFVAVTGETTLTEHQHIDVPERVVEYRDGESHYLPESVSEDGLDDAIESPSSE